MRTASLPGLLAERAFARDTPGYEAARRATLFNARVPDRFPDLVVQARDVHDVVAAVKYARVTDLKIGVRSGGHSWSGNHVRDGGMLLDVSRLRELRIEGRRAIVGPGVAGSDLAAALWKRKLFFPAGHCLGVCVGGYLLQGGFGWHGRALGPACASVEAIDVVTADGALVHASEQENADLYWAARGSGAGFFGVVTRFHLRCYPRPRVVGIGVRTYGLERVRDVFSWAHAIGREVPASVELQILMDRRGMQVVAPVFADSLRGAWRDVRFLRDAPPRPTMALPFVPMTLPLLYRGVMTHYPHDARYAVDNMWTRAPIASLLPGIEAIAQSLPPPPSHVLWLNWAPPPRTADMAFSMEDDYYLALYGVWRDAADDARYASWAVDHMRRMAPLATGVQLADENLGARPAKFIGDAELARLDRIRAERDPDGRFHPWMGRP